MARALDFVLSCLRPPPGLPPPLGGPRVGIRDSTEEQEIAVLSLRGGDGAPGPDALSLLSREKLLQVVAALQNENQRLRSAAGKRGQGLGLCSRESRCNI